MTAPPPQSADGATPRQSELKADDPRTDVGAGDDATDSGRRVQSGSPAHFTEAGTLLGVYRLDALLGQGGTGSVWKALHTKLDKHVAIKILPRDLTADSALVNRFEREMRAVGKLDHPHIIRAMDAGEVRGTHFLVMEYVDGNDLSKVVARRGPLPVNEACEMIRQAALGLAFAHAHGLVHRDVKPSNLFLTKPRTLPASIVNSSAKIGAATQAAHIKVLDLGLALLQGDASTKPALAITRTQTIMGTPDYMAPEQWEDTHTVDARADLYSLGCTLFCLLTGRAPFQDAAHASISKKMLGHLQEPPPDLKRSRLEAIRARSTDAKSRVGSCDDVPDDLDDVYRCLLAKRAEDRIPTADLLAKKLLAIVKKCRARSDGQIEVSQTTTDFSPKKLPLSPTQPQSVRRNPRRVRSVKSQKSPRSRFAIIAGTGIVLSLLAIMIIQAAYRHQTTPDAEFHSKREPGPTIEAPESPGSEQEPRLQTTAQKGWHGWDSSAPQPAIAPFDAEGARRHQKEWAEYLGIPSEHKNSLGMRLVLIPPGEYMMGGDAEEIESIDAEIKGLGAQSNGRPNGMGPQHRVILTSPIYFGVHEVTQAEFQKVMGRNPSTFQKNGSNKYYAEKMAGFETSAFPVDSVDWCSAADFCLTLSEKEDLSPSYFRTPNPSSFESRKLVLPSPSRGNGYRLPTEAEWEFACRAGTTTRYWTGDSEEGLSRAAWIQGNSGERPHPIGELMPNPFGLFDIHGNLLEWVHDVFDPEYYGKFTNEPAVNPEGPPPSEHRTYQGEVGKSSFTLRRADEAERACRGGCAMAPGLASCVIGRGGMSPYQSYPMLGFRVVLPIDTSSKRPKH